MTSERFSGTAPLLVGIMPKQHPEVLQTAAVLAARLSTPLVCAYVDEASYLVEWDPARSAHRLSRHPDADDDMLALTTELNAPLIIVGTSERGFTHRLSEALNGSVGTWLSHHQGRPVLVVPYRMPAH